MSLSLSKAMDWAPAEEIGVCIRPAIPLSLKSLLELGVMNSNLATSWDPGVLPKNLYYPESLHL